MNDLDVAVLVVLALGAVGLAWVAFEAWRAPTLSLSDELALEAYEYLEAYDRRRSSSSSTDSG